MIYPARFKGSLTHPATQYVAIPVPDSGRLTIHIAWKDATSSATIVFQTSLFDGYDAPFDAAGAAWEWETESAVTITGPAAAAAGSETVHVSNLGARVRARLVITTAATSDLEIYSSN